jgi:AraC-like DNA-binding protein
MARTTGKQQSSDTTVRIATLTALPVVLEQLGYDPATVLAEQEFDLSLFDNPDNTISYARRSQLIQHCVNRTGCLHFGHLIGRQTGSSSLGLVGLLMQQSTDVVTALRSLVRFTHLHVRGAVVYLEEQDDMAFLGYSIIQPGTVAREQIEDGAVTIAFNILRKLCGPSWQPLNVLFAHRKPMDTRPFRQFFKAPLNFDAERNGVLFSASWLQQPVVGADPKQQRLLQEQVDQLENHYKDNFAEQVRRVLHPALLTQQASADHIAALFSIHQRTMHRRLNACSASFQKLADESRFEITRQLLENSSMKLSQIAETLDYADASAFTRAFRRWSGTTPSLWRERYQEANANPVGSFP